MCGIALSINGLRFQRSSLICDYLTQPVDSVNTCIYVNTHWQRFGFSNDDLETALQRRGPDSLGTKKLFLRAVPEVSSFIEGHESDGSRTLWFGRDAFGRESLLVHWPKTEDSRFLLTSVSPDFHVEPSSGAASRECDCFKRYRCREGTWSCGYSFFWWIGFYDTCSIVE